MKTTPTSIPDALNRHLSAQTEGDASGLAAYVDRGSALVNAPAVAALHSLLPALHAKIETVAGSALLRRRLKLLVTYFEETVGGPLDAAQRDVTFALLYFLKGFDRIPDSVPEIGLLDDAMIVEIVLQRHTAILQAHWARRQRAWPERD